MSQLGQFLDNLVQQQKQISNAGKSADYFVKANPAALDDMGIHEEEWANLGARDKMNAVQGYVQGKAVQRQSQEAQAQMQLRQAEAAKAQTEADSTAGMPDFAKFLNEEMSAPGGAATTTGAPTWPPPGQADWSGLLQGNGPVQTPGAPGSAATRTATAGGGQPAPMSQAVLRALARVQSMNPRVAAAIATKILPGMINNNQDGDGVQFTQDPVTGKRFATHGKILAESGIDPAFASAPLAGGAVPMKDETGNVIGYNIPIGGGKFKPMASKDLTDAQKQNLILQHQKEKSDLLGKLTLAGGNTNIVSAINDEMASQDEAISNLKSGTKAGAPAASTPAKVSSQAQFDALPSGTVYVGKDGKSYRKP